MLLRYRFTLILTYPVSIIIVGYAVLSKKINKFIQWVETNWNHF